MGWGRTLLLGDIGNRMDIADTEEDIAKLKRNISLAYKKDMSQDEKLKMLMRENAELKLYLASITRLLLAKGVIGRSELENMVTVVDREDGKADGQHDGRFV